MPSVATIDPTTGLRHDVRTFWSVQILRAVAALMVVIGHTQSAVGGLPLAHSFTRLTVVPWGAGVDLFFVISGFVMVHASRPLFGTPRAARTFLERRIARVVPLYWTVTGAFLVILAAATLKGGDPFPSAVAIVASLLFFPFDTWGNGLLFPVVDLGWTLNYELFFYALFAICLWLPRRRAIAAVFCLLFALTVLGTVVPPGTALTFWTRPIVIDFALGVAVGAMVAERWRLPGVARLALGGVAIWLLLDQATALFAGPVGMTVANAWPRVILAGLPSAMLIAAATLGPEPALPAIFRPLTAIGDASYSLYLTHPFALIALEKAVQKLGLRTWPPALLVTGTVIAAILLALLMFRAVERPITARLTAITKRKARAAVLASAWRPS